MDKKGHDFVLEKDIRRSVTRLTLSLNKGYWVDKSVDIYELINNEFEHAKKFIKLRRNAIKDFHMSCYFDEGSDAVMRRNVWRIIDKEGASKDEPYALIGKLREAVIKAEGGRLYGVEIFFIESCIYLMIFTKFFKHFFFKN